MSRDTIISRRPVAIGYSDGRPFDVVEECQWDHSQQPWFRQGDQPTGYCREYWDFEFCKKHQTLYRHNSGGGGGKVEVYHVARFVEPVPPKSQLWLAEGVQAVAWESNERPEVPVDDAELLRRGYLRIAEPLPLKTDRGATTTDPFEASEEADGHLEYCSICDDWLLDDDLCDHIADTDSGDPIGAGLDDGAPSQESFFCALDWMAAVERETWHEWCVFNRYPWQALPLSVRDAVDALERHLAAAVVERLGVPSRCIEDKVRDDEEDADASVWDDCADGFAWLTTLGPDTPKANATTLQWILEWRLSRLERDAAQERKRLIEELTAFAPTAEKGQEILAALGIPGGKRADLDTVPTERIRAVLAEYRAAVGTQCEVTT